MDRLRAHGQRVLVAGHRAAAGDRDLAGGQRDIGYDAPRPWRARARDRAHRVRAAAAGPARLADQLTRISSLPKFLPSSMPMNAAGAFSRPSTTSSRYFSDPSRTHAVALERNSSINS